MIICVPTPLTGSREPDLTYLLEAATASRAVLQPGQLVVLESTTYPGTTRERLAPILEESGLAAGRDFHLAFSPERIDPGRTDYTIATTPKLVGGITEACAERARELYALICEQVIVLSTPEAAELSKLLENIFRSVNIALVNELAQLCDRLGIDVWEVIDAAATKPFGFMRFDPGPGMGGHCLPIDPFYLAYKAREHGFYPEFIELAGKVNQAQPRYCVQQIERALNGAGRPTNGSTVLILGVSYKAGIGDIREAPALKMIPLLQERGASVSYHDPHVHELAELGLASVDLDQGLADCDVACVVTAHSELDYSHVAAAAPLVVDFRGVLAGRRPPVRSESEFRPLRLPSSHERSTVATRPALEPLLAEIAARQRAVLASGRYVLGPEVEAFEREFAAFVGVRHCVGVANGTEALTIALRALGIEPGDEVVVPALTFYATAEAVVNAGARPVFCDVDPRTFNMTAATAEPAIGERTAALLPVHLFGNPAPMAELRGLAETHDLRLLEDAAQAAGATLGGRRTGSLADAAAFSFFPSKNLGGFGDGGAILTDDDEVAATARRLRAPRFRGQGPPHRSRLQLAPRRAAGGRSAGLAAAPRGVDGGAARRRQRLRGCRPRRARRAAARDERGGVLLPPLRRAQRAARPAIEPA